VTTLDWIIIGFVALMAMWGYLQGLVVSALSLAGFALGAIAGSRLAPLVLDEGSASPYAPLVSLAGALMLGALAAVMMEAVGEGIRRRLRFPGAPIVDGVGGALLVAALGLGIVWMAGAVALTTPGASRFRQDIQRSAILAELNRQLPPSGPILNTLARFDPFPRIDGPDPDVPAPTRRILRDADVRAARDGVVRVVGTACGLSVQGSGWIARPETVVTNAHVVAGQDDTTVTAPDGTPMAAQAIEFDPRNDIAVLRVDGLGATTLEGRTGAEAGEPVAILGFPEDGPFVAQAGRLGATQTVISEDAYGRGPVQRRMTALRGEVRSGNSGGPVVDGLGRVVATVFAATTEGRSGGYAVPGGIVAAILRTADEPVDTGPCTR
jgi:S1-C subfamily serine protease